MKLALPPRALSIGASVAALVALSAGAVAAGTDTTEPGDSSAGTAPGCAEITAALDAADELGTAFLEGDFETVTALLDSAPELGAAAADAAPPEIADDVATWVAPLEAIAAALEGVDLSDVDAVIDVLSELPAGEAEEDAHVAVEQWAAENCGWTSSMSLEDMFADAPEPPDCEILDAAAAADAAGLEVDVSDLDGSFDFSLPGFWTKSCSYGNGTMSLSTLSFNSLEQVQQFYEDNLENAGAVFVADVDLRSLPASTIVTQVAAGDDGTIPGDSAPDSPVIPSVTVSVLEATIPFSVSFTGDDVDPATAVAAAEAVLAALPAEAPTPETTVAEG
jgi:hypothetical protein